MYKNKIKKPDIVIKPRSPTIQEGKARREQILSQPRQNSKTQSQNRKTHKKEWGVAEWYRAWDE